MSKNPKIDIERTQCDQIWYLIHWALVSCMFLIPALYYDSLPDTITTHFNGKGEADGFGSKRIIFLIPVISLILHLFLNLIRRYPHTFNYAIKITPENAYHQYRIVLKMIDRLRTIILVFFLYITIMMVHNADGNGSISIGFATIVFMIAIFATIITMVIASTKYK